VRAVPPNEFTAWLERTRGSGTTLDAGGYTALAKQSINVAETTFGAVDPGLFQKILNQQLPPGPGPGVTEGRSDPHGRSDATSRPDPNVRLDAPVPSGSPGLANVPTQSGASGPSTPSSRPESVSPR
jgi:hypothetical protein